jgi:hypothetical protein
MIWQWINAVTVYVWINGMKPRNSKDSRSPAQDSSQGHTNAMPWCPSIYLWFLHNVFISCHFFCRSMFLLPPHAYWKVAFVLLECPSLSSKAGTTLSRNGTAVRSTTRHAWCRRAWSMKRLTTWPDRDKRVKSTRSHGYAACTSLVWPSQNNWNLAQWIKMVQCDVEDWIFEGMNQSVIQVSGFKPVIFRNFFSLGRAHS